MYKPIDPDTHPDDSVLNEYLDNELLPENVSSLEGHLASCTACTDRITALEAVFATLADMPDLPLERDLSQAVLNSIQKRDSRRRIRALEFNLVFLVEALAAATLLAAAGPFFMRWFSATFTLQLSNQFPGITDSLLRAWSDRWQVWMLSGGDFALRWRGIWDQFTLPTSDIQIPLVGIIGLLAAALLVWLAGNGMLLRSHLMDKTPHLINGGKYD